MAQELSVRSPFGDLNEAWAAFTEEPTDARALDVLGAADAYYGRATRPFRDIMSYVLDWRSQDVIVVRMQGRNRPQLDA